MSKKDNALAREMMARHNYALAKMKMRDAMRAHEQNGDPALAAALYEAMIAAVKESTAAWGEARSLGLVLK